MSAPAHADGNPAPPHCPRCGYDLSGAVATWSLSCPITGVCSECGLAFDWRNILDPKNRDVPWLYEHAPRWWNIGAALRTLAAIAISVWFWTVVRVHHRV